MELKSTITTLCCTFASLMALAAKPTASPLSVTKGEPAPLPVLNEKAFVVEANASAISVPLDGWYVNQPRATDAQKKASQTGYRVWKARETVRGEEKDVLKMAFKKPGKMEGGAAVIQLNFPFNAEEFNVLSFSAKINLPTPKDDARKSAIDRRIWGDGEPPRTGWNWLQFDRWFDNFRVGIFDGHVPWMTHNVAITYFMSHRYPETRSTDGFVDFAWDMKHEDHAGNKGFVRDRAQKLEFGYYNQKLEEGEEVVITIADIRLVKGSHIHIAEPELYAGWTNFVANYTPDYSDSSHFLEPPKEGRISRPIQIAKDGIAQAEIVVDLSEAIRIDNFFPNRDLTHFELEAWRGYEVHTARAAALYMQKWLKKLTGADYPVLTKPSEKKNVKIYLGAGFAKKYLDQRTFDADIKAMVENNGGKDGFAVRERNGNIFIYGAAPVGTRYGVQRFLENNTDIIWAFPDDHVGNKTVESGTVYTVNPNLSIVWGNSIALPAFIQRETENIGSPWLREVKEGAVAISGGHYFCPQYYYSAEAMQSFNSVIDGQRVKKWREQISQCCLTQKDFGKWASEIVPGTKNFFYTNGDNSFYLMFGPDDNYGLCECENCQKPIKTIDGRTITAKGNYGEFYSARFYEYLNTLDDKIQKVFPGFITSTYAYFFTAEYPPIKVNKTIVPMLCTYVHKAANEPYFAPANQHWWKMINDWIAHDNRLMFYDYYSLETMMKPYAEVVQADAKAFRDIGFLRNYSEGEASGTTIGTGDEGWCVPRILWNPDVDVEQLHRYYNRRVYREAAPWIDKFRGVIRENFYKRANRTLDFEEDQEIPTMIVDLGLENELRGYLQKAKEVVRHPMSKVLVDRMIVDFDAYMQNGGFSLPSRKTFVTEDRAAEPLVFSFEDKEANYEQLFNDRKGEILNLIRNASEPERNLDTIIILNKMKEAADDRRIAENLRSELVANTLNDIIRKGNSPLSVDQLLEIARTYLVSDVCKARGRFLNSHSMSYFPGYLMRIIQSLFTANRVADAYRFATELYIEADADLPIGMRAGRRSILVNAFNSYRAKDLPAEFESYQKKALASWRNALEKTVTDGANEVERCNAKMSLLEMDWDKTSDNKKLSILQELIADKFLASANRESAARKIEKVFVVEGKDVNWRGFVNELIRAVQAGDWSQLPRNTYFCSSNVDRRLTFLTDMSEMMMKTESHDAVREALRLFEQGGKAIGYGPDTDPNTPEEGVPPGSVGIRLKQWQEQLKKIQQKLATLK